MELKECPFCGSDDIGWSKSDIVAWAECANCDAEGPTAPLNNEDDEHDLAYKAWNRRDDALTEAVRWHLELCGMYEDTIKAMLERKTLIPVSDLIVFLGASRKEMLRLVGEA
jgi:Lar family restriction alleviation protein